jgi:carbon-monoxide dehydrogenase medium subunit
MKAAAFTYHAPYSLEDAVTLLEADPDAKLLAGGQSLVPLLALRLTHPSALVDLGRIAGLAGIDVTDGALRIGAMTAQAAALRSPAVAEHAPLLHSALRQLGHLAIRNRGTVGGSVAHADPAAEIPAALVCLGAELLVRGPAGERRIAAGDFFLSPFQTALSPAEVLVRIDVPQRDGRWAFHELARRAGDYAMALAAVGAGTADGICTWASIVLGGVGGTPVRARQAEASLVGARLEPEAIDRAADLAVAGLQPGGDVHATSSYRIHLVRVLVRRALREIAA